VFSSVLFLSTAYASDLSEESQKRSVPSQSTHNLYSRRSGTGAHAPRFLSPESNLYNDLNSGAAEAFSGQRYKIVNQGRRIMSKQQ
jgi:hypothetical protein